MTLPRFLGRIADATGPLLTGLETSAIGDRLEAVTVALRIDATTAALPGHHHGYLFAVRLAARLYPNLMLDAPADLHKDAAALARAIHPEVAIVDETSPDVELVWGGSRPEMSRITLSCDEWTVRVDDPDATPAGCVAAVAMAAAAIGMSEVFRAVFAEHLETGRVSHRPWTLNLVTCTEEVPDLSHVGEVDLGKVHLAGCGAVGQAAVAALATMRVRGELIAVDHERLDVGNLQRYVLALDKDVGKGKTTLVERHLKSSALAVTKVPKRWGDGHRTGPGAETVLTAVDSKRDRIAVQASLPRVIYNAWTQPDEAGFSRHEHFGHHPCLACVCWPRQARPSTSQLIAKSLGVEELRVLHYIHTGAPVGAPLPVEAVSRGSLRLQPPPTAAEWAQRSLLEDVGHAFGIDAKELAPFANLGVQHLYRDGVCAQHLHRPRDGHRDDEVSVPLAHQSALAGVLLAIGLFTAKAPALREHRPAEPVLQYQILAGGPQELPSPQLRHPACLCHDADFLSAFAERWPEQDKPHGSREPEGG